MKLLNICCLLLAIVAVPAPCLDASATGLAPAPHVSLAGRIGGSSLAVAVRDGYAFLGQGAEFTVVDVRDAQNPQRLAYLPLAANDVALQGSYAFVTNKDGLAAIDITDVAAPVQTSFQATAQALTAVYVDRDYAYAIAPRAGLFVYSIGQPAQPQQAGFLHLPDVEGVAVLGEYVYLAASAGLQIISVADPQAPVLVATQTLPPLEAVAVAGRYAYLTAMSGALLIADIANPAAPALIGAIALPSYTKGLHVVGDTVYVANGANGIAAVDVRDPSQPRLIGVQAVGALVTDVVAAGDLIWATDVYDGGLHVLRSSPLGPPVAIAAYRVPGVTQDAAVGGQYAYLVVGRDGGIAIVNLAAPGRLQGAGYLRLPRRAAVVQVHGDRLYVLDGQNTLQVLDLANPVQPAALGTRDLARNAAVIAAEGSLFFVRDESGLLHVFDVAGAGLPEEIGMLAATGSIHDAVMTPDYLLAAAGALGVVVAPRSGGGQPAAAQFVAIGGSARQIAAAGSYAYVMTGEGSLVTLDLSRPGAPFVAGQIALGIAAREIVADAQHVYIAAGDAGVYVLDAATAGGAVPGRVLAYDTPGVALHVELAGSGVLVADGYAGLLLLGISE